MTLTTEALSAACTLLTENRYLVEAITASNRGKFYFRPDYESDLVDTAAHLDKVELEAHGAANICAEAGLLALANACRAIAHRIGVAKRNGVGDREALPDLSRLTTAGVEALDAAEDVAAGYSRV